MSRIRPSLTAALLAATMAAGGLATAANTAFAGPPGGCPPGLAKKGSCAPPGQRKQWHRGDVIPKDVSYRVIVRYGDFGYGPPPKGHVYVEIDGSIYLMAEAAREIIKVLSGGN